MFSHISLTQQIGTTAYSVFDLFQPLFPLLYDQSSLPHGSTQRQRSPSSEELRRHTKEDNALRSNHKIRMIHIQRWFEIRTRQSDWYVVEGWWLVNKNNPIIPVSASIVISQPCDAGRVSYIADSHIYLTTLLKHTWNVYIYIREYTA